MERKEEVKNIVQFFALLLSMIFLWTGLPTIITVISISIGLLLSLLLPFLFLGLILAGSFYGVRYYFRQRRG